MFSLSSLPLWLYNIPEMLGKLVLPNACVKNIFDNSIRGHIAFEIEETYKSSQELSIPLKTSKVTKKATGLRPISATKSRYPSQTRTLKQKKSRSAMPSPRMKRIDINADRKQTSDDCTRVARGKNAAQRTERKSAEE